MSSYFTLSWDWIKLTICIASSRTFVREKAFCLVLCLLSAPGGEERNDYCLHVVPQQLYPHCPCSILVNGVKVNAAKKTNYDWVFDSTGPQGVCGPDFENHCSGSFIQSNILTEHLGMLGLILGPQDTEGTKTMPCILESRQTINMYTNKQDIFRWWCHKSERISLGWRHF